MNNLIVRDDHHRQARVNACAVDGLAGSPYDWPATTTGSLGLATTPWPADFGNDHADRADALVSYEERP
ncbi:hypothetical protein [Streptosporangium sp. CA-115845]|uniref:hypothetical protein n=1 Tax=Streptosporangium sp. CA-115845 TaxID=3240071 RepID=UPI003D94FA30